MASRQLDAEPDVESAWHALGRSLVSQGRVGTTTGHRSDHIVFRDLGTPAVLLNSEPVRPRIAKTYELLAFLVTHPDRAATREQLLTALFDGRADDASRAYLRQAVRWLKALDPADGWVLSDRTTVALAPGTVVRSESVRFETAVAEANRLRGSRRIEEMTAALSITERGAFLDGTESPWAARRRQVLLALAAQTRTSLATHLYEAGRLMESQRQIEQVLESEPLRESGWRLRMRIAAELGDSDGVIIAFRQCEDALEDIGMTISLATRRLLENLSGSAPLL
ncbi:AfsR/SARP family transcriptional regulator [Streptomyces cucumeris]|uniref:AfsR/SARP family transcriptional regulator n=1 Tax=Streptomyces cucumeris TaxID=2962890 RepID=UPI003D70B1A2